MIVVCDLDGTVSDHSKRIHHVTGKKKDYDAYYAGMVDDEPYRAAVEVLPGLVAATSPKFFFLTGRPAIYRQATDDWLWRHFNLIALEAHKQPQNWNQVRLVMRPDGDYRKAVVFKEDFIKFLFTGGTNGRSPILFFDDDMRNKEMCSRYGIFFKAPECWEVLR